MEPLAFGGTKAPAATDVQSTRRADHPAIAAQAQADAALMTQQAKADADEFKEEFDESQADIKRVVREVSSTGALVSNTAEIGQKVLT